MFQSNFPVLDLHRHLDGNLSPELIWSIAQRDNIVLPANSVEALRPYCQIQQPEPDLLGFLAKLDLGVSVLSTYQAIYDVAYDNVRDAKAQGIDYAELRFSPYYMAKTHQLDIAEVVNQVAAGVADGCNDFDVQINLIGILSRTFGVDACWQELEGLLAHKDKITALDLAGDELNFPGQLFEPHFAKGRDAGWHITVHAGEAAGPDSIWHAIEKLGATRIGHGVAAVQDTKLMHYMAEHKIAIESCLTSNYQTATVTDIKQHPVKQFLEHGITVCINTDDPAVSGITLANEFHVAKNVLGLTDVELARLQENALRMAFIDDRTRQALLMKAS